MAAAAEHVRLAKDEDELSDNSVPDAEAASGGCGQEPRALLAAPPGGLLRRRRLVAGAVSAFALLVILVLSGTGKQATALGGQLAAAVGLEVIWWGQGYGDTDYVVVDLELTTCQVLAPWFPDLPEGGYFTTRCYDGQLPGPVIRARPGATVTIRLRNSLELPNPACPVALPPPIVNTNLSDANICELNTTNLHGHGLHVSPHEDSIYLMVAPGDEAQITLTIPRDHMPGTHWYHPHSHHSTAVQAGGGAHGFFIIEDPPNSLPSEVQHAKEHLLLFSLVDIPTLMRLETWGEGNLWQYSKQPGRRYEPSDVQKVPIKVLVSGSLRPELEVAANKWHRFRMLLAAVEMNLEVYEDPDVKTAQCQYQLLAKDGVYLLKTPRKLTPQTWNPSTVDSSTGMFEFASGNRADVLVSCSCQDGASSCALGWRFKARLWQMPQQCPPGTLDPSFQGDLVDATKCKQIPSDGVLLTFKVTSPEPRGGGAVLPTPTPASFRVRRPCYLVDLQKVDFRSMKEHQKFLVLNDANDSGLGDFGLIWGPDGGMNVRFTGLPLQGPLNHLPMLAGGVYEVNASGVAIHPMHIHTVPYQLQENTGGPDNWVQAGDYVDVFRAYNADRVRVRLTLDRFTGRYIVHCHKLEHEDNGMMGYLLVDGDEGAVWPKASRYDRTCFRAHNAHFGYVLA